MNKAPIKKWIEEHNPQGLETLAGLAKVPAVTIKKLLSDKNREPHFNTARKLAKAIGVAISEIYDEDPTNSADTTNNAANQLS